MLHQIKLLAHPGRVMSKGKASCVQEHLDDFNNEFKKMYISGIITCMHKSNLCAYLDVLPAQIEQ